MFNRFENILSSKSVKQAIDPSNIVLYLFGFIVLMVSWSGLKTIQTNYKLQQKIAELEAENELQKLENQNAELKNKFYSTDEYLDLAARRQFGKAAEGEKLYVIPKDVALSKVDKYEPSGVSIKNQANSSQDSKYIANIKAWRQFLSGQKN